MAEYDDAHEILEDMVEMLTTHGPFAYGDDSRLTEVAQEWIEQGFNPDDADDWLSNGCFEPTVARAFKDADLESDDVGFMVQRGVNKLSLVNWVCSGAVTMMDALTMVKNG